MKKILFITLTGAMALASCTHFDFEAAEQEAIKQNAEEVFGLIDPKQDWSNITSGSVTLTADANLKDISKVQILSESPYFNDNAVILAEADVKKGETVTLNYDAPKGTTRLIATCIDSKGNFFTKGFDIEEKEVSFAKRSNARTRGTGTRSDLGTFNASRVVIKSANALKSFNAGRTMYTDFGNAIGDAEMIKFANEKNIKNWAGTKWQDEVLWTPSSTNDLGSWSLVDGSIVRNTEEGLDDEEKAELNDIFKNFLKRDKQKNNLQAIRNSDIVTFFGNHMISNGQAAITLIPVQMASTEISMCDLYYYYYKDVPASMNETDYIKQLPKYKAISCSNALSAAGVSNGNEFFRAQEYLLPYYGDGTQKKAYSCTSDGKIYRMRNGQLKNNKSYYLTYIYKDTWKNNMKWSDKLDLLYDDNNANLANQLWQIFTTGDGKKLLYNVGTKKFLVWIGSYLPNYDYATVLTDYMPYVGERLYTFTSKGDAYNIWRDNDNTLALGTDLNQNNKMRVSTNKTASNGALIDWYFDEYTGNQSFETVQKIDLPDIPVGQASAVSAIIPQGYKVGFMLRKANTGSNIFEQSVLKEVKNGCVYGNGELNTEINVFPGHFGSSSSKYDMKTNDPRIAIFSANNKTYLAFEDGADSNYSDMIIEIGGSSTTKVVANTSSTPGSFTTEEVSGSPQEQEQLSGVYMFDTIGEDITSLSPQPFTMCFEDRLVQADYDMNDLVLRCIRDKDDKDIVHLSVIAVGAYDRLYIRGIEGELKNGTNLMSQEVHALFGKENAENDDRYINTKRDVETIYEYKTGSYKIGKNVTIPQFLTKIYIENETMGKSISVPETGQPPFALIIPGDFNYPYERTSIIDAYTEFKRWTASIYEYGKWLDFTEQGTTYTNPASGSK